MLHIKSITPMFTSIVTTADKFEEDYTEGGIVIASKGDYKPWQTVVSVGDVVRNIKPGDKVMINLDNYVVRKYQENSLRKDIMENKKVRYEFNFVTMDDADGNPNEYFLFKDRDVLYTFEGEEKKDVIQVPKKKLILS